MTEYTGPNQSHRVCNLFTHLREQGTPVPKTATWRGPMFGNLP